MSWRDLITIRITDSYGLAIGIGPLLIALLIIVGAFRVKYHYYLWRRWSIVEAEVLLGGIGKVKLHPHYDDIQVAHKAWVELVTRKAALPFDKDHDVISDVYNSWYALFQEMRSLAKSIPAERLRTSKDTKELVRLLVEALNNGLRPHLTKWQARFRHWFDEALKKDGKRSPQEVQRDFPQYQELVSELVEVNKQLVDYADVIRQIAHGSDTR